MNEFEKLRAERGYGPASNTEPDFPYLSDFEKIMAAKGYLSKEELAAKKKAYETKNMESITNSVPEYSGPEQDGPGFFGTTFELAKAGQERYAGGLLQMVGDLTAGNTTPSDRGEQLDQGPAPYAPLPGMNPMGALASIGQQFRDVGNPIAETGANIADLGAGTAKQAGLTAIKSPDSVLESPLQAAGYYAQQGLASAPTTLAGMLATAVNPAAGSALMFSSGAGSRYADEADMNTPVMEAANRAAASGAYEAATEALPFETALGRFLPGGGILQRTAKTAATEALGEGVNSLANDITDELTGREVTLAQAFKNFRDSTLTGLVSGGVMGGVGHVLTGNTEEAPDTKTSDRAAGAVKNLTGGDAAVALGADLVKQLEARTQGKAAESATIDFGQIDSSPIVKKFAPRPVASLPKDTTEVTNTVPEQGALATIDAQNAALRKAQEDAAYAQAQAQAVPQTAGIQTNDPVAAAQLLQERLRQQQVKDEANRAQSVAQQRAQEIGTIPSPEFTTQYPEQGAQVKANLSTRVAQPVPPALSKKTTIFKGTQAASTDYGLQNTPGAPVKVNPEYLSSPVQVKPEDQPKETADEAIAFGGIEEQIARLEQQEDAINTSAEYRPLREVVSELKTGKGEWYDKTRTAINNRRVRLINSKQAGALNINPMAKATYHHGHDAVYVVVDRVGKDADMPSLMAHEFTHAGYQKIIEKEGRLPEMFNRIRELANSGSVPAKKAISMSEARVKFKKAKYPNLANTDMSRELHAETLAHFVEFAQQAANNKTLAGRVGIMFRNLVSSVKSAMDSLGLPTTQLTENDIVYAAKKYAKQFSEQTEARPVETARVAPVQENAENVAAPSVEDERASNITFTQRQRSFEQKSANPREPISRIYHNIKNKISQIILPRAGDSPVIRSFKEQARDYMVESSARVSSSRNRILGLMVKHNITPNQIGAYLAGQTNAVSNPEMLAELKSIRKEIDLNSLRIIKLMKDSGVNLTKEELGIINKIRTNLGKYFTTTYQAFLPGEVGRLYRESLFAYAGRDEATAKNEAERQNIVGAKNKIEVAKTWLKQNLLAWPDDLGDAGRYRLERLYEGWTGQSATNKELPALISELEEIKSRNPSIDLQADVLVNELVGLTNKNSPTLRYFRGSKLDRTIITPKEDIPEALRELWGQVHDPVVNMFTTWAKQENLISQMQTLNKIKTYGEGKFLFKGAPPDQKYSETLQGAGFGALEGMYTTPEVKRMLDAFQDANAAMNEVLRPELMFPRLAEAAIRGVRVPFTGMRVGLAPLARITKVGNVVMNPANYVVNFGSSPLNLLANGNFDVTTYWKGMKGVYGAIGLPYRKAVDHITSELAKAGALDSAWVGEMRDADAQYLYDQLASDLKGDVGRGITKAKEAYAKASDFLMDFYAVQDLWPKAANYLREKKFLRDFYKRHNIQKSEEDLIQEAGERIKRTNFSYIRAIPILKGSETVGLTMFGTYFGEVYRTLIGNQVQGWQDIAKGTQLKDAKLVAHGVSRVAGSLAATVGHKTIIKSVYFAPIMFALGAVGVSDEDEEKLRAQLPDKDKNKLLAFLQTVNGTHLYWDLSRMDTFDPFNSMLRAASTDGMEGFKSSIGDLVFANTALVRLYQWISGQNKDPSIKYSAPDFYADAMTTLTEAGMDATTAGNVLRQAEATTPAVFKTYLSGKNLLDQGADTGVALAEMAGFHLVQLDPIKNLERSAGSVYKKAVDEANSELAKLAGQPNPPSNERLEKAYIDALTQEYEAWSDLAEQVRVAKSNNVPLMAIAKVLRDAKISQQRVGSILNGRFVPAIFDESFLSEKQEQLIKQKRTFEEKAQVRRDVARIRQTLNRLRLDYKKYLQIEENN